MSKYRTGNRNARNIYRVTLDGEQHVGCMFTEDDGRHTVAALNATAVPVDVREAARWLADQDDPLPEHVADPLDVVLVYVLGQPTRQDPDHA